MGQSVVWSHRVTLPPNASSAAAAREFTRARLVEHDLSYLVEDVRLVASELATNAALHAKTAFTVLLEGFERMVRVSVSDDSVLLPVVCTPSAMDTAGRGLGIVDLYSRAWGVTDGKRNAKWVWATFEVRSAPTGGARRA